MNTKWKALGSIAVAFALVVAPLAASGAVADDVPPVEPAPVTEVIEQVVEPVEEAVVEPAPEPVAEPAPVPVVEAPAPAPEPVPVVEAPAPAPVAEVPVVEPVAQEPNEGVCTGTHLVADDGANDEATETYTAPEGFLISAYCVKAGSIKQGNGPEYVTLDQPVASITITHSSGKDISHFSVTLIPIPDEDIPVAAVFNIEPTPPTCENYGNLDTSVFPIDREGYTLTVDRPFDGPGVYTITAVPDEGYVIEGPTSIEVTVGERLEGPYCEVEILPPTVNVAIDCESESEIEVTATNPNDENVVVTAYFDFNGDNVPDASEDLTIVPGETVLHYNFGEDVTIGVTVLFDAAIVFDEDITVNCDTTQVYPIPALFNAEPTPATCTSAGTLPDFDVVSALITVTITPEFDGPGEYVITVTPEEDVVLTLENVNAELWTLNEDGTATRTIVVQDILTDPVLCPLAGEPITLGQPTLIDECGTDDDGASLPADQEGVTYAWQDEDADDNWNIVATVDEGLTVTNSTGWVLQEDGTYLLEWNPTFTDEACGTTPPPPGGGTTPPPVGKPAGTPTGSLAVTGSADMAGFGLGALALLLMGGSAMALRRRIGA